MTHFPPLYPALLAALAAPGADPLAWVRPLHAALLLGNVLLVAWLIATAEEGSPWAACFGATAVAASVDVLGIHAMALSEPLFLLLTFSSLGILAAHLARPR